VIESFRHVDAYSSRDILLTARISWFRVACDYRYMNADEHEWNYEPNFRDQQSFLRITITPYGEDPPVKVTVNANGQYLATDQAFVIDRTPFQ